MFTINIWSSNIHLFVFLFFHWPSWDLVKNFGIEFSVQLLHVTVAFASKFIHLILISVVQSWNCFDAEKGFTILEKKTKTNKTLWLGKQEERSHQVFRNIWQFGYLTKIQKIQSAEIIANYRHYPEGTNCLEKPIP